MNRLTKLTRTFFAGAAAVILALGVVWAQTTLQQPRNPQTGFSSGVTYVSGGDPTAAAQSPTNGEVIVCRDCGSDGGPSLFIWDAENATADRVGINDLASTLVFEGATDDAFETTFSIVDPTGDTTYTFATDNATWDGAGTVVVSDLLTNAPEILNSIWFEANNLVAEGTADAFEHRLAFVDTTGDTTYSFASDNATWDGAGTVMVSDLLTNAPEIANAIWGESNNLVFESVTADAFETRLLAIEVTADRTYSFANAFTGSGTVATRRASTEGLSLQGPYLNPWRFDFQTAGNSFERVLASDDLGFTDAVLTDAAENRVMWAGYSHQVFIEQAHTVLPTVVVAAGLNLDGDATDNEGQEIRAFGGDDDLDVGWNLVAQTDAGYFEVRAVVTDSSETDQFAVGFLTREAHSATNQLDTYDTYCMVGIGDAAADPRDIVIQEELNGGGGADTDTTVNVVDGTAFTIRVEIEADGTCDTWVNGTETNTDTVTFDAADFLVPVISFQKSAGDGSPDPGVFIEYVEVGYLN